MGDNPLLTWPAADARRRIHVWSSGNRAAWAIGPTDVRTDSETPGAAIDQALSQIGHEPAVIVYEGRGG